MLEINEKTHISTVIGSLDKIYKESKMYGRLYPNDIYLLDILNKLLSGCPLILSESQYRNLIEIYNRLSYKSKYICPTTPIKKYQIESKPKFIQAEAIDCNDFPTFAKIVYWQEESMSTTNADLIDDVIVTGFLDNKLSDTYTSFEIGKTISYSNIGRICFLALDINNTDFEIKDSLGNIISDQFDKTFIDQINSVLIVSKNIYSHGDITLKIKKPS